MTDAIRGCRFPAGPGLAAVSGGADSVALLRGLVAAGRAVAVAHFNHRLRGAEADADEAFVRGLAAGLGLPFHPGAADVAAEAAARKGNVEAVARELRYDWLARTAAEAGAAWVATGHTADDQAETVLHRLIRGAGLHGLRGIAAERAVGFTPTVRLVRPLLAVTRADVLGYLTELGQPFREDATNADPALTRSRIRHELLPLLRTFNPDVVSALGRAARHADEAAAFVAGEVTELLHEVARPPAAGVYVFAADPLAGRPGYLVREFFRTMWASWGWPAGEMTAAHWDRLAAVARGDLPAADFPSGVWARRVGRVVQVGRRS